MQSASQYYLKGNGKYFRPIVVLLVSRLGALTRQQTEEQSEQPKVAVTQINEPISPLHILKEDNPLKDSDRISLADRLSSQVSAEQRRLAEITEMIHVASLLHDDVIDASDFRRSLPSSHIAFSNKIAILAGDFLLGRASLALSRLRNCEVVELLSTVIVNLVEGELMQLRNSESNASSTEAIWNFYLQKTYLKTASLISKSCRAAAILGGLNAELIEASYTYGKNLGILFQLVDDVLDFTSTSDTLGKPSNADLEAGLATAPVLFAMQQYPEIQEMMARRFTGKDDIAYTRQLVEKAQGIRQTLDLAEQYAQSARDALQLFVPCNIRDMLESATYEVVNRQK